MERGFKEEAESGQEKWGKPRIARTLGFACVEKNIKMTL
jgi:hypothetical protein